MGKLYVIYRDRGSTESCHDAEQLLHQSLQHITDSEFIHADISNYAEIFNRILQENDEGGLLIVDAGDRFVADYVEKLWLIFQAGKVLSGWIRQLLTSFYYAKNDWK